MESIVTALTLFAASLSTLARDTVYAREREEAVKAISESLRRHDRIYWPKNSALEAMGKPTQDEVNRYYKLTKEEIIARFGEPVITVTQGNLITLRYEGESAPTEFVLWESQGYVREGKSQIRGVRIQIPQKS